jgi:hypothetical protein
MHLLRKHWYDLGGFLALFVFVYVFLKQGDLTRYEVLMWFNLISLFLHQLEEYRVPGTFPGMINTVMYHSKKPDRYPLNANTALVVNVVLGWSMYLLAAVFAEKAVWLGMTTILVSTGNVIAHTVFFNIKGKSVYNAGLFTCWLLFVPCAYFFFTVTHKEQLVEIRDYFVGIPLGIAVNFIGVLKLIGWMADENSAYIFGKRHLLVKKSNV